MVNELKGGIGLGVGYQYTHARLADLNSESDLVNRGFANISNIHEIDLHAYYNLVRIFSRKGLPLQAELGITAGYFFCDNHWSGTGRGDIDVINETDYGLIFYPTMTLNYQFEKLSLGIRYSLGLTNSDFLDSYTNTRYGNENDRISKLGLIVRYKLK